MGLLPRVLLNSRSPLRWQLYISGFGVFEDAEVVEEGIAVFWAHLYFMATYNEHVAVDGREVVQVNGRAAVYLHQLWVTQLLGHFGHVHSNNYFFDRALLAKYHIRIAPGGLDEQQVVCLEALELSLVVNKEFVVERVYACFGLSAVGGRL